MLTNVFAQTDADREQHKREHMARLEELQKFSRTFQVSFLS